MMLFVHNNEARRGLEILARMVRNNVDVPYPFIRSVINSAGVNSSMSKHEVEKRLQPYADELLANTYQAIAGICRDHKIVPLWVYLPFTYERRENANFTEHVTTAEQAGLVTFSLKNIYDKYDPGELYVAAWDDHPNAIAHKLVADRLLTIVSKELFKGGNANPQADLPSLQLHEEGR